MPPNRHIPHTYSQVPNQYHYQDTHSSYIMHHNNGYPQQQQQNYLRNEQIPMKNGELYQIFTSLR